MIGIVLTTVSVSMRPAGLPEIVALDRLSLEIEPGSFTVIVGPNGAGKTTLLNLLGGQLAASVGRVGARLDGADLDWSQASARGRRGHVSYIRQDPREGSIGDFTVAQNLRLAALEGMPSPFRPDVGHPWMTQVEEDLENSPLEGKAGVRADELSGGQRQLLAIEMAAARKTPLFLLDEPTASLDADNARRCMERTAAVVLRRQATALLVTHDFRLAADFGDRLIVLDKGQVIHDLKGAAKQELKAEDVFRLCFDLPVRP